MSITSLENTPIPDTLTILINTRIPGYQKIKYSPSMTVPKSTSNTVYFDPLVKLSSSIVNNPPTGEDKFSQFFDKSQFYSLVTRTLSSTFQKKVDLVQASESGYVDNDIEVILKTLFATNNKFYIQGKPYTIYNYEWTDGDWRVDINGSSRTTYYYPYSFQRTSTKSTAQTQLEQLKKNYPVSVLNGRTTSDKFSRFDDYSNKSTDVAATLPVAQPVTTSGVLPLMSSQPLASSQPMASSQPSLAKNSSINVDSMVSNVPSDPISLSLLYTINDNYANDVKTNPIQLEPLYNELSKSREQYNAVNNDFMSAFGENLTNEAKSTNKTIATSQGGGSSKSAQNVVNKKQEYDNISFKLKKLIDSYIKKGNTVDSLLKNEKIRTVLSNAFDALMKSKKDFLTSYLYCIKLFLLKLQSMITYFQSLVAFYKKLLSVKLSNLKKNENINDAKFENYLLTTLFTFDIQCYESILNDPQIFNTMENYKKMVQSIDSRIQTRINVAYNFKEQLDIYFQYPQLFNIQTTEFSIYIFKINLFNAEFESLIWKNISTESIAFLDSIKTKTYSQIKKVQQDMDNFKNSYTQQQQSSFKTIIDEELKSNSLKKQTPIFYESANTKLIKQMTNEFITIQNEVFLCYDMITLFSKVSPIIFSRETHECDSKKSVHSIKIQIFGKSGFQSYYDLIYKDTSILPILQSDEPLFWTIQNNIQGEIALNNNELSQENDLFLKIDDDCNIIQKKYTDAADLLVPQISAIGMKQQCLKIMVPQMQNQPINKKEEFFSFIKTKYDLQGTEDFRRHLLALFYSGINDGILEPLSDDNLTDILTNVQLISDENIENSLFTCVSVALNSGLINANSKTINPYSENGLYSDNMLRDAVADNITQKNVNEWSNIESAFSHYSSNDPERMQYNFLFDENNHYIGNDIELVKSAIRLDPSSGGKYSGNYATIQTLEKVFKVKMIVIHVEFFQENKNFLPDGTYVRLLNNGNEVGGTVFSSNKSLVYKYDIILDDHTILRGVERKDITYVNPVFFTVLCDDNENEMTANEFTHYIILLEIGSKDEVKNYQLFFDSKKKQSIFEFDELPSFIYYSVFNNCAKPSLLSKQAPTNWYFKNSIFNDKMDEMKKKYLLTLKEKAREKKVLKDRQVRASQDSFSGGSADSKVLSVPNKNLYTGVSSRSSYYLQNTPKLSYFIVIDLELYPGESIPIGEKAVLGCQNRYEKIRKAYAQLFGIKYFPTLFLRNVSTNEKNNKNNSNSNNIYKKDNSLSRYNRFARYPNLYNYNIPT